MSAGPTHPLRWPGAPRSDGRTVESIIFDFDGVLVDTAEDIAVSANIVLRRYGLRAVSIDRVRGCIGGGAEALMRELLSDIDGDATAEAAASFKTEYARRYDVHTRLYPGVQQMLEQFLAAGLRMAVATNKIEPITRGLIARLGLEPYFLVVVGPESVTRRKPDPEVIDLILSRIAVAPAHALMIGDKAADILAGKAAGTFTCGVLYGYGTEDEIAAASPDFLVRSIAELPLALNKLETG
jgi:phosphoglycolate phosphatase